MSQERGRLGKDGIARHSGVDLAASFKSLLELVGDSPDRARKVRNALFCGDKLRPGVLSIRCLTAGRAGEGFICFELGNRFREVVAALATVKSDGKVVKKV